MDQERALAVLGLGAAAATGDVERAYSARSRILKRRIVQAASVEERNHNKRLLRDLIEIRDRALGPEEAERRRARRRARAAGDEADWWEPSLGVPTDIADRRGALQFFGLGPWARGEEIREVFHRRSRLLKAHIARASTEHGMQAHRDALRRLNELYHLATSPRPAEEKSPQLTDEETLTDVVSFQGSGTGTGTGSAELPAPGPGAPRDRELEESAFELEILLPGDGGGKPGARKPRKGPEETL